MDPKREHDRGRTPPDPHGPDPQAAKVFKLPRPEEAREIREAAAQVEFLRFTKAERIQHIFLMISFTLLILTGMPLLIPKVVAVKKLFFFSGSFALRGLLHRFAAIILIGLSIYHTLYILFTDRGHEDLKAIVPKLQDLRNFIADVKYKLGLQGEKPRWGRFTLYEKFEYWAVVWGSIVMITTGFMLWFEEATMAVFPKWVLDVVTAIHSYEAILAFLAIIIWHMYNVHLNPDVFPMSKVWLTGRITGKEMLEHHPLEYEEMMRQRGAWHQNDLAEENDA